MDQTERSPNRSIVNMSKKDRKNNISQGIRDIFQAGPQNITEMARRMESNSERGCL